MARFILQQLILLSNYSQVVDNEKSDFLVQNLNNFKITGAQTDHNKTIAIIRRKTK